MNSTLIIATVAAGLSLATTAFAADGSGDPFGYHPALTTTPVQGGAVFNNAVLMPNGQNGPVESANSLPDGAWNGTDAGNRQAELERYYTRQADHRLAQRNPGQLAGPNG